MLGAIVTILTVILVLICLLMSLVILMQRPKQEGLGAAFGGALTDRMLGSGTTDFLQKATVAMGVAFFVLSLTIATLMAYDRNQDRKSLSNEVKELAGANTPAEETTTPAATGTTPPAINLNPGNAVSDPVSVPPLTAPEVESTPENGAEPPASTTVEDEAAAEEDTAPEAEESPAGDGTEEDATPQE